jgi:hypothetical protein
MKKYILSLLFLCVLHVPAFAQICNSVPYSFVAGTTISSAQVNANFQALLTCINANAANAPANTNITSLAGLTNDPFVPSGMIAFFDLSACPSGWSTANGSGGTPDIRGTYIRDLDQGAGRDPYVPTLGQVYGPVNGPMQGTVTTTDTGSTGTGSAPISGTGTGSFSGSGSGTASSTGQFMTGVTPPTGSIGSGTGDLAPVVATVNSTVSTTDAGSVTVSSLSGSAAVPSLTVAATGAGAFTCTDCNVQLVPVTIALLACQKN